MINATIALNAMTRPQRAPSPMTRGLIASAITSRKRLTRPCKMTSPLCQVPAMSPEEGVYLIQDLLCACSCSCSCSCSSSRSYDNHHVNHDDSKASAAPKHGYLYSKDYNDGHYHCPDKSDTIFATFPAPTAKKSKRIQK
jgi:hypothetical protein